MSRNAFLSAAFACFLLAWPIGAGGDTLVPALSSSIRDGRPLWVAEDVAFEDNGDLRHDRFTAVTRYRFETHRAANVSECRVFAGAATDGEVQPSKSLEALAGDSRSIISGKIIAARQGFFAGRPGTLFAVEVQEHLKKPAGDRTKARVLLFVGNATIATARGLICAKDFSLVSVPALGDRVLFFSSHEPFDADGEIYAIDTKHQLIVQTKSGLSAPVALSKETASLGFEGVLGRVRIGVANAIRRKQAR
jgi:hypothetical protein